MADSGTIGNSLCSPRTAKGIESIVYDSQKHVYYACQYNCIEYNPQKGPIVYVYIGTSIYMYK